MKISRILLSIGMIAMGVAHLAIPGPFVRVMPAYIPAPALLVWISGLAEIALGAALQIPRLRRLASWGLIALFVTVFPANVDMALHPLPGIPAWLFWLRLPLQIPLIYWAYRVGLPPTSAAVQTPAPDAEPYKGA